MVSEDPAPFDHGRTPLGYDPGPRGEDEVYPVQDHAYEKGYEIGWAECQKHLSLRIEALRAAAEIQGRVTSLAVAAAMRSGNKLDNVSEEACATSTIEIAEQFAQWLETGE